MPSKRIIVLDRQRRQEDNIGDQAPQIWKIAFWADVPATRQSFYADTSFVSAFRTISTPDLAALQNGSVAETTIVIRVDKGSTIAQLQLILQDRWTAYQATVNALNPWNRYGTSWDGATWTAGGVA